MIQIEIPQRGTLTLQHAVFDINGTLAIDGRITPETVQRLSVLKEHLTLHFLTAATHGNVAELERTLELPLQLISKGEEKMRYVQQLGPSNVVAIGNGMNDIGMLRLAALGIVILSTEGLAARALQAADVLVSSPVDAIDLLLRPKRLIATLRG